MTQFSSLIQLIFTVLLVLRVDVRCVVQENWTSFARRVWEYMLPFLQCFINAVTLLLMQNRESASFDSLYDKVTLCSAN